MVDMPQPKEETRLFAASRNVHAGLDWRHRRGHGIKKRTALQVESSPGVNSFRPIPDPTEFL